MHEFEKYLSQFHDTINPVMHTKGQLYSVSASITFHLKSALCLAGFIEEQYNFHDKRPKAGTRSNNLT